MGEYLTTKEFYEYMDGFKGELVKEWENRITRLETTVLNGHSKKESTAVAMTAVKYLGEGLKVVIAALLAALGIKYLN